MSIDRPLPDNIPTLTEVVEWPDPAPVEPILDRDEPPASDERLSARDPHLGSPADDPPPQGADAGPEPVSEAPVPPDDRPADAGLDAAPAESGSRDELARNVLVEVQRQVDLLLDVRMREALAPALTRTADALVRDARREITAALRDIVDTAVAHELARRQRP